MAGVDAGGKKRFEVKGQGESPHLFKAMQRLAYYGRCMQLDVH